MSCMFNLTIYTASQFSDPGPGPPAILVELATARNDVLIPLYSKVCHLPCKVGDKSIIQGSLREPFARDSAIEGLNCMLASIILVCRVYRIEFNF